MTKPTMRLLVAALVLAASPVLVGWQAPPPAAELAARVQAHYATVRDFTASFSLTQTSALRPAARTDRGQLKVRKPLKMRWTYDTSEKQQLISDGLRLYVVFPQDRYVQVCRLPEESDSSTFLLFLAGRGNLTRDYVASLPSTHPAGEWRLTLKPLAGTKADFESMTLEVDRRTYQIKGMVAVDDQGSVSTYRFTNIRENPGVSDKEFEYTPPRNYDLRDC
jgi:outer membrane lipoprotein carrier protein